MKISAKQYARSLYESLEGRSEGELSGIIARFAEVLIRNRHTGKLKEIISCFEKEWAEKNREVVAQLTGARELDENAKDLIIAYLKKKTEAENINLEERVDEKILGGFILRYGNKVVDGSLKNNLEELKHKLSA